MIILNCKILPPMINVFTIKPVMRPHSSHLQVPGPQHKTQCLSTEFVPPGFTSFACTNPNNMHYTYSCSHAERLFLYNPPMLRYSVNSVALSPGWRTQSYSVIPFQFILTTSLNPNCTWTTMVTIVKFALPFPLWWCWKITNTIFLSSFTHGPFSTCPFLCL